MARLNPPVPDKTCGRRHRAGKVQHLCIAAAALVAIAYAVTSPAAAFTKPPALASFGRARKLRRGDGQPCPVGLRRQAQTQEILEGKDLYGTHDEVRTLFHIEKLVLRRGQKVAVVGANGCGKSTLIAALAGRTTLKRGDVKLQPGVQVRYVEQEPKYDVDSTVMEAIYKYTDSPAARAMRRYRLAAALGDEKEIMAATDEVTEVEGWDFEEKTTKVLEELGLAALQDRTIGTLSGGQRRRVALACAVADLGKTDILVLDEPTNHLSAEGCDWLQETLQAAQDLSLVLVTHDRYFLDEVCDEILEIDGLGETFTHPGGWNTFLKRRAERYAQREAKRADAQIQLKVAREWMSRGARGRQTKNKAQIAGYFAKQDEATAVIKANDGPPELENKELVGNVPRTVSAGLVSLRNVTVSIPGGGVILDKVSFFFEPGAKVGIVGPNGAGKSTLLRTIVGDLTPESGEVTYGEQVNVGFLSQEPPVFGDPRQKMMDVVMELADEVIGDGTMFPEAGRAKSREGHAAALLRTMNFPYDRYMTQVGMLSGGEKRRLQLLRVLARRPNVLLLDEPTNDLDAVTVDALERMLQPWPGTVILVSHDRSLLDGVCKRHIVFPKNGGQPEVWLGSHAELREFEKQQERDLVEKKAKQAMAARPAQAAPRSPAQLRRDRKKLKQVEEQIEKIEEELEGVAEDLERDGNDAEKSLEHFTKQEELSAQQAKLYEEWEALTELVGE